MHHVYIHLLNLPDIFRLFSHIMYSIFHYPISLPGVSQLHIRLIISNLPCSYLPSRLEIFANFSSWLSLFSFSRPGLFSWKQGRWGIFSHTDSQCLFGFLLHITASWSNYDLITYIQFKSLIFQQNFLMFYFSIIMQWLLCFSFVMIYNVHLCLISDPAIFLYLYNFLILKSSLCINQFLWKSDFF